MYMYQGQPYQEPSIYQEQESRENVMGLVSMAAGILSVVTACCVVSGFFFGGLAVLFAALSRVDERLNRQAKTGLIAGIAGILLGAVSLRLWIYLVF